VEVCLELDRPAYSRHAFCFVRDGRPADLLAVTLRAGVPPLPAPPRALEHPYLLFDRDGLEDLRRKARRAPFPALTGSPARGAEEPPDAGLPPSGQGNPLAITPRCMNWFRVAKESMLRDGAGGRNPACRRVWELLPPAAQETFRDVVRTVEPTPGQLEVLTGALNEMLARRDFHDAAAFAEVPLPEEAVAMLRRAPGELTDAELFRLNRTILQCTIECMPPFGLDLAARAARCLEKWVLGGDERLAHAATRWVQAADQCMILSPHTDLHEGGVTGSLALAYDAFWPDLSPEERQIWVRVLSRLLELHLRTARKRHWNCTTIANANPVCNGGGGLAALALLTERPDLARESLALARKLIWNWADYCNGPNGGNTEGAQYWQYGAENFLRFASALERVVGSDDGLLSGPSVRRQMGMIRVGLCADGCLHGVNDTIPMPVGGSIAWWVAGRTGEPLALWYGDHAQRVYRRLRAAGREAPYRAEGLWAVLFRPDVPEAVDQPPLPTAFCLDDIQYAVARSGTNYDCGLVAGLKGSRPPYTHHNQPDTGSFFLDVRGERLLIDPGYYKDAPTDHSLPIVDGAVPAVPAEYVGRIIACRERGDLRYLACDATPAYGPAAGRVVRHLVLVGEEGLVLLDDVVPTREGAEVVAQYQAGGPTADLGGGRAVLIAGRAAKARLEVLTRPALRLELRPERSLHDVHWGYHFAECRHFPLVGRYAADAAEPLVTVFTDVTDGEAPPARVVAGAGRLGVRMPSGREVGFVLLAGGWAAELGP